jgi:hypothetical protein
MGTLIKVMNGLKLFAPIENAHLDMILVADQIMLEET